MTQNVRLATIQSRLVSARQSLHLAVMLSEEARIPTRVETEELEALVRQCAEELNRLVRNLLIDLPPKE